MAGQQGCNLAGHTRFKGSRRLSKMADKGVELRPVFRRKNPCNRTIITGIRAQPINGFGWKGHQPALLQAFCRLSQAVLGYRGGSKCRGYRHRDIRIALSR